MKQSGYNVDEMKCKRKWNRIQERQRKGVAPVHLGKDEKIVVDSTALINIPPWTERAVSCFEEAINQFKKKYPGSQQIGCNVLIGEGFNTIELQ